MFGNKKPKIPISKNDIKKAIKNANEKLKAQNKKIESNIKDAKGNLKSIQKEAKEAEDLVKSLTNQGNSSLAQLEATQSQIFTSQCDLAKVTDSYNDKAKIELALSNDIKELESKKSKLEKRIDNCQAKLDEYTITAKDVKSVKAEIEESKKSLKTLKAQLTKTKKSIKNIDFDMMSVQADYNKEESRLANFKVHVSKAINTLEEKLKDKEAYMLAENARIDNMMAERLEELQTTTELLTRKEQEYKAALTHVMTAESKISKAQAEVDRIVENQQIRLDDAKSRFENWKLTQLDQVAKLKLKGKIENIDKAGLKEILDV